MGNVERVMCTPACSMAYAKVGEISGVAFTLNCALLPSHKATFVLFNYYEL